MDELGLSMRKAIIVPSTESEIVSRYQSQTKTKIRHSQKYMFKGHV